MSENQKTAVFDANDLGRMGLLNFCIFAPDGYVHTLSNDGAFGLHKGANLFAAFDVLEHIGPMLEQLIDEHGSPFTLPNVTRSLNGHEIFESYAITPIDEHNLFLLTSNRSGDARSGTTKALRHKRSNLYADDLLATEKARFDTIYKSSPILGFALDQNGVALAMTERFLEFFGSGSDDMLISLSEILEQNGISRVGAKLNDLEIALTNMRHEPHIFQFSAFVIDNQVANRTETYGVLNNITAQWANARAINKTNDLLSQTSQALEVSNTKLQEFAHVAAHDLVAPIGRIKMLSEIISRETEAESRTPHLSFALNAIDKTSVECIDTVKAFLEYARIDGMKAHYEALSLKDTIGNIYQIVSEQFQNGKISKLLLPLEMQTIKADKHLLDVILLNIISNAFKYRKEDGSLEITVEASVENMTLSLAISDNGKGFTIRENIDPFDRYTRMESAQSITGTGLGLAMVKTSCIAQNWDCKIYAKAGVGTRLKISGIEITQ